MPEMQRDMERLADRHFQEHLSVRAIIGWRTCISVEQTAVRKVPTIAHRSHSHMAQGSQERIEGISP